MRTIFITIFMMVLFPCLVLAQSTKIQNSRGMVVPGPRMNTIGIGNPNGTQQVQLYGVYVPPEKAAQAQKYMHDKYRSPSSVRMIHTDYGTKMQVNGSDLGQDLVKRGFAVPDGRCTSSTDPYCRTLK